MGGGTSLPGHASKQREIPALTGLRFVAASSIVITHGQGMVAMPDTPLSAWLSSAAGLGMPLFFVLSGFVIHYNYHAIVLQASWRKSWRGTSQFLWARFARLYPLFLVVLVFDILFPVEAVPGPDRLKLALPYYLTLTQAWFYEANGKHSLIYMLGLATPATWSISTEWFFYLIFPAIAFLVVRLRKVRAIPLVFAALAALWVYLIVQSKLAEVAIDDWAVAHYGPIAGIAHDVQDSFFRWLKTFFPYMRIGEFIYGALVAQLYLILAEVPLSRTEHAAGRILTAISLVATIFSFYLLYIPNDIAPIWLLWTNTGFGMAPAVAALIFCLARYDTTISRLMATRPFIMLGDASYSIYLLHPIVFTSAILGPLFQIARLIFRWTDFRFIWFAMAIAVVFALSLISYRAIEVPSRRWLRDLYRDDRPGFAPAK